MLTLRPFQVEAISKMADFLKLHGACYNACEMGLGKCVQALKVLEHFDAKKILVICPASVVGVWYSEIVKWDAVGAFQVISYNKATTSAETLAKTAWDFLILDEAHYVKSIKAKRTQKILKHIWPSAKYKICLSGTPFTQSVMDCWPVFSKILPQQIPPTHEGYWKFAHTFTKVRQTPWGIKFEGIKNPEKLRELTRNNFLVRYTKKEVLTELPAKTYQKIPLPKSFALQLSAEDEAAQKVYIESLRQAYATGGGMRAAPPMAIASARREQGIKKIKPVADFCKDLLDQNIPLVVFAYHRDVISGLKEALNDYKVTTITGDTSSIDRQLAISGFQTGEANCFIGQFTAAGTGITLTRSSTVILPELDWSPANISQAIDRCHRIGQRSAVNVYYFVVQDSLDEHILDVVMDKAVTFNTILEG